MQTKTVDVRFKAGPEDGLEEGEFVVYPSTFTKTPDAYGDIIAPGAFQTTIKKLTESGMEMPALYGHRMDDPDFFVGGALGKDMIEDDHGWLVRGRFDLESPKGPQTYRLVKAKRLNQLSFAYDVLDEGQVELENGTKANELRDLLVHEFSFVPVGANSDTSVVAVKVAREIASKAGRVISAKNETNLRTALEGLEESAAQIKNVLAQLGETEDPEKAAAPAAADEEPLAKSDPPQDRSRMARASITLVDAL